MGLNEQLRQAIRQLAGTDLVDGVTSFDCTVVSVDEDNFTCVVDAIGDNATTEIPDVRLAAEGNDGFTLIPSVGSTVTVVKTDRGLAYVSMFSDIDKVIVIINNTKVIIEDGKITFNDGAFYGLAKVAELTQKYNNLENQMNSILVALQGVIVPLAPSGTYPFAPLFAALTPLTPTTQTEIENTKIIHG